MRVLHVVSGVAPRMGGPALNVVAAARALRGCGVEATVFSTDLAEPAAQASGRTLRRDELPGDVDVRLFPVRRPRQLAFSPALDRALAREVRAYDVVHIHSLYLLPQFSAFRHALHAGIPYVVAPCGALDPYLRQRNARAKWLVDRLWQRRMLDMAALIHFKTEEERRLVADLGLRAPSAVVPNGLDEDAFTDLPPPVEARRLLGLAEGPVVLSLGRISHKKGLDLLVDAFARVREQHPDAQLVIAGPDDEGLAPGLQAQAEALRVADAVHFPGMVTGTAKAAMLAAADVWVLPSRTENFGSAVAEALAAGRATVVSPAINLAPDLRKAGAALVADLEVSAVAAAVNSLLVDDVARGSLGERGREFALRYRWSSVACELSTMYDRAAALRRQDASVLRPEAT